MCDRSVTRVHPFLATRLLSGTEVNNLHTHGKILYKNKEQHLSGYCSWRDISQKLYFPRVFFLILAKRACSFFVFGNFSLFFHPVLFSFAFSRTAHRTRSTDVPIVCIFNNLFNLVKSCILNVRLYITM